jgi:hypothetical protein
MNLDDNKFIGAIVIQSELYRQPKPYIWLRLLNGKEFLVLMQHRVPYAILSETSIGRAKDARTLESDQTGHAND